MGAAEKVKDFKNLAAELNLNLDLDLKEGRLFSAALELLEDLEDALFEEAEAEDETSYAVRCPNCGGRVVFDESALDDDIICPACGEILRFDTPEDVEIDDSED